MRHLFTLPGFVLLWLFCAACQAGTIEIMISGELNLTNGADINSVNGASFAAEYQYDTAATFIDDVNVLSFFAPLFGQVAFSNRPNSAADVALAYQSPDRPLLIADNQFAPSTDNDSVTVQSRSLEPSNEFATDLIAPEFIFDLGTQDFFSGPLAPAELFFSNADVSSFSFTNFRFVSGSTYAITGVTFAVRVIQDSDNDGVEDADDNCTMVPNGPDLPDAGGLIQYDSDGDGFGNACDPDLNNDGTVDFGDLPFLQAAFFTSDMDQNWNPDADLNGDGSVDFGDLPTLQMLFFDNPGPSGLVPP